MILPILIGVGTVLWVLSTRRKDKVPEITPKTPDKGIPIPIPSNPGQIPPIVTAPPQTPMPEIPRTPAPSTPVPPPARYEPPRPFQRLNPLYYARDITGVCYSDQVFIPFTDPRFERFPTYYIAKNPKTGEEGRCIPISELNKI
jgi:hypothetical protein